MSDPESGIDVMRARIERGRRTPPAPRRERAAPRGSEGKMGEAPAPTRESATPVADPPGTPTPAAARSPRPASRGAGSSASRTSASTLRLTPSTPWANLAIRVRRPLDDRLADLIHDLRREDVRTSKVELIEMLLWEMEPESTEAIRRRLARFRRHAPRAASAEGLAD